MTYLCNLDTALFEGALRTRLEAHNEQTTQTDERYELCAVEENTYTVRVRHGLRADLLAHLHLAGQGDQSRLTVTFEKRKCAESGEDGDDGERRSFAAALCARLTVGLLAGALLWGIAWGIGYSLGNRNPFLPLSVPAAVLAVGLLRGGVRAGSAKKRFLSFLTQMLGTQPVRDA
jgi:hypothetical protein